MTNICGVYLSDNIICTSCINSPAHLQGLGRRGGNNFLSNQGRYPFAPVKDTVGISERSCSARDTEHIPWDWSVEYMELGREGRLEGGGSITLGSLHG